MIQKSEYGYLLKSIRDTVRKKAQEIPNFRNGVHTRNISSVLCRSR